MALFLIFNDALLTITLELISTITSRGSSPCARDLDGPESAGNQGHEFLPNQPNTAERSLVRERSELLQAEQSLDPQCFEFSHLGQAGVRVPDDDRLPTA